MRPADAAWYGILQTNARIGNPIQVANIRRTLERSERIEEDQIPSDKTIQRTLQVMEHLGYVEQSTGGKRWYIDLTNHSVAGG